MKQEMILTVDSGTTNTRVLLWRGECVIAAAQRNVGVRDTARDGNNARLRAGVKQAIEEALAAAGASIDQVAALFASGMITSNVGLYELPHLIAPASQADFVAGVREVLLEDVCSRPICFIPGLKNRASVTLDTLEEMDIIRGEEVETLALLGRLPAGRPYLFVLPGSHMKFISVSADRRIQGILTSIAGELLSVLSEHTILADSVQRGYLRIENYRRELLFRGYRTAKATSFSRAAFSTRILSQFISRDPADAQSFLLGAVLQNDVQAIRSSAALTVNPETEVIVSGKEPFSTALIDLLTEERYFADVRGFACPEGLSLSGLGALAIAKDYLAAR